MTPPDWSLYRAFAAALQHGSLTAAARELGLSQPTLGRRIGALEAHLGYALFSRSPEGLTPTPEAQALRPHLASLEAAAATLGEAAAGVRPIARSLVRVAASEIIAAEVLPRALRNLRRVSPDLELSVSVSNGVEDILRREADIAVRMTRPHQPDLLGRKVGDVELGLFAHPSCFASRAPPSEPAELKDYPLIGFETPRAYTQILQFEGEALRSDQFVYRTDSDTAQIGAIRAGLGIGVCHVPLASGLSRVLAQHFCPRVEMWLVINRDLMRTRRFRQTFRSLSMELGGYVSA